MPRIKHGRLSTNERIAALNQSPSCRRHRNTVTVYPSNSSTHRAACPECREAIRRRDELRRRLDAEDGVR